MTDIDELRKELDDGKVIICGSASDAIHTRICRMVTHEDNDPRAIDPACVNRDVCTYCSGEYRATTAPNDAVAAAVEFQGETP